MTALDQFTQFLLQGAIPDLWDLMKSSWIVSIPIASFFLDRTIRLIKKVMHK